MKAVVTGKLKFKGAFEDKAALQKKVLENRLTRQQESKIAEMEHLRNLKSAPNTEVKVIVHPKKAGSGRITTSGTTVSGSAGITRAKVSMVLSDRSLILEAALPRDIITFSQFDIQKQDTIEAGDQQVELAFAERLKFEEEQADTRPVQTVVEIKKKSGMWGYKTERIVVNGDMTREEVIKMRAQHKKDKWC